MSGKRKSSKALSHRPGARDYEVGYARPPKASRFKPGVSGNPGGRPKGAKNKRPALHEERLKAIVLDEAYRTINVRDGARNVTVPIAQAVIRALAVNAAKGDHRAQRLFAELLGGVEAANYRHYTEWVETAIGYKVDWDRELDRRRRLGIAAPDPVPHPDDIEIDMNTGEVIIKGPMTQEEKDRLDRLLEKKAGVEQDRAHCLALLRDETQSEVWPLVKDDLAYVDRVLSMIDQIERRMRRRA